jgi:IS30 family transposase
VKKTYKKLDLAQRYRIEALLDEGYSNTEIADRMGVHKSTISRELKRNTPARGVNGGIYSAERAQRKADKRERTKGRACRITDDQMDYIRDKLIKERWSPELISQRGRMERGDFMSHEWIYLYIWKTKHSKHKQYEQDKDLHTYLRHSKRRSKRRNSRQNRGCIPNRTGIENRPKVVDKRKRYGDYEVDFMMGKNHKPGLIVLTDRATLKTKLIKTNTKKAKVVAKKIIRAIQSEKTLLKTVTFDNDLGFAEHQMIAKALDLETYFTRPYTSQDKGTVENRIGVMRRFFPKGKDMTSVHHSTIKAVERKLNRRPVRKFNYLTPEEKYASLVALDT